MYLFMHSVYSCYYYLLLDSAPIGPCWTCLGPSVNESQCPQAFKVLDLAAAPSV